MSDERLFPIHPEDRRLHKELPRGVPWDFVAPHESWAQSNHGQSLKRLAERGGLGLCELVAVLEGRRWRSMDFAESWPRVQELLAAWRAANPGPYPNDRSRHGRLVHDARPDGRYVRVTAYLEGGDRPITRDLLCRSPEQAQEIARVLRETEWQHPP